MFFPGGGIGRYTYELVKTLSRFPEVAVEVVCSPDFRWKDTPAYPAWDGLQSIWHAVPTLRRLRFLTGQFVNPARGIRHAQASGTDVLHFSNINHLTFPFWRRLLKKAGMRVAISVHDVKRHKRILSRWWEDRQLKACYRYADALFVHSAYQARELMTFAGVREEKIHIVPHGPYEHGLVSSSRDEIRAALGLAAEQSVGLFFGQIRDEKNLDRLIRALSESTARPYLIVAGQGGSRHRDIDYYQNLAREVGVADQITFIPRFIPDEEVGELFTAADWIALPYSNTFTSQSGVLNVAAHYERPILVSSSPVLKETVETCDIGVVCRGDATPAIAEGIDRICARIREGHLHKFEEYRDQFSWHENAQRTLAVYQALVPQRRRRGEAAP